MDTAELECQGPAIKVLGSLFKLTEIFLWDDTTQVASSQLEHSKVKKLDSSDDDHGIGSSNLSIIDGELFTCDSDVIPEDVELTRQMSALDLPLSFNTSKERNGSIKGKRKGVNKKNPNCCPDIWVKDAELLNLSVEEVVFPAHFHSRSSLCCMSMLGQSELSYPDIAVDVSGSLCALDRREDPPLSTENSCGVSGKGNVDLLSEVALTDHNDIDCNDCDIMDTCLTQETHLDAAGQNGCEEHGEKFLDDGQKTQRTKVCNGDNQPVFDLGLRCNGTTDFNNHDDISEWVVCWDDFYMRNYFYNTMMHTSTWYPPPGMEHFTSDYYTETNVSTAMEATITVPELLNKTDLSKDLSYNELEGVRHRECLIEVEATCGNCIPDTLLPGECKCLDFFGESIGRDNSCNNDHPFTCLSSNGLKHIASICSEAKAEDEDMYPAEAVFDTMKLDTENVISVKKQKKVRRTRRQRKLSGQEGFHFQGTNVEYSTSLEKYWCQRYVLFSKFDDGIKMDEEGWFSVTPEPIARHQALRCAGQVIVDCFAGVGGNAIQFATRCKHVIAIDIDRNKIDYARHNAAIYGVDGQIDFINGDFFVLASNLQVEIAFLSPPWGGPDYSKVTKYDMNTMLKPHDGHSLFAAAKQIAPKVVMFLPRNVDINQLAEIALSTSPPWSLEVERNFLNWKLKAITAYFSDTAGKRLVKTDLQPLH